VKISDEQRRCNTCGCQVEADAESCPACGGKDLVRVKGPALAHLIALHKYLHAQRTLVDEEPMVRCAFCGTPIAAAKAFHSHNDGRAVCWTCKQAEEANA
jgi:DNA-directed RNA polymerase subunit RPC12/RpoP